MKRIEFLKDATLAVGSAGLAEIPLRGANQASAAAVSAASLARQSPKSVIRGKKAVCSSADPKRTGMAGGF